MTWVEIIIKLIIPALGAVITYHLVPFIKAKNLNRYVTIAVFAAEQILGSGTGAEKFEYVKKTIKQKFNISDDDLKNIIESVVLEMNRALKA